MELLEYGKMKDRIGELESLLQSDTLTMPEWRKAKKEFRELRNKTKDYYEEK